MFKSIKWQVFERQNLRDLIHIQLIDDQGLDLLQKMLEYDPARRISARQAIEHPYFSDVQLPY